MGRPRTLIQEGGCVNLEEPSPLMKRNFDERAGLVLRKAGSTWVTIAATVIPALHSDGSTDHLESQKKKFDLVVRREVH